MSRRSPRPPRRWRVSGGHGSAGSCVVPSRRARRWRACSGRRSPRSRSLTSTNNDAIGIAISGRPMPGDRLGDRPDDDGDENDDRVRRRSRVRARHGVGPVATGRSGSADHADHEPTYTRGRPSPTCSITRALWQAVTPEPQYTMGSSSAAATAKRSVSSAGARKCDSAVEVVGVDEIDRAGDVAGNGVDRLDLAGIAGRVAAVDHDAARGDVPGDVVGICQRIGRPRRAPPGRPARRRRSRSRSHRPVHRPSHRDRRRAARPVVRGSAASTRVVRRVRRRLADRRRPRWPRRRCRARRDGAAKSSGVGSGWRPPVADGGAASTVSSDTYLAPGMCRSRYFASGSASAIVEPTSQITTPAPRSASQSALTIGGSESVSGEFGDMRSLCHASALSDMGSGRRRCATMSR